jgi:hypothetical protein
MVSASIYPNGFLIMLFFFFFVMGFLIGWNFRGDYNESVEKRAQELRDRDIEKRQMDNSRIRMVSDSPDENIE